jgi:hypothetical protein
LALPLKARLALVELPPPWLMLLGFEVNLV